MAVSIYSYVLDLIRKGFSQAASFVAAEQRFPGASPAKVSNQWLNAWGGKYTADLMREFSDSTFEEWLNKRPIGSEQPNFRDDKGVIQSWFGTVSLPPYDISVITSTTIGDQVTYGTWRYRAGGADTYTMFARTTLGIIAKEYRTGANGTTEFLNQYIIGTPKDM